MKIKFLLALLFVVGLGFTSVAQSVTFGPRIGVNLATQVASGEDEEVDFWNDEVKSNAGLQIGAVANVMVSELFSIQPELLYSQKGYKLDLGDDVTVTGKYSYLEVPVLAKISFGTGPVQGFVTAGPTLGYWMSGKDKAEFDGEEDETDVDFEDDEDGVEKRFEAGASIGVGLAYKVGTGALNLDVRYGAGLTSVYDFEDDSKLRNSGISISVAYLFGK